MGDFKSKHLITIVALICMTFLIAIGKVDWFYIFLILLLLG